jgi:hypothetical protein
MSTQEERFGLTEEEWEAEQAYLRNYSTQDHAEPPEIRIEFITEERRRIHDYVVQCMLNNEIIDLEKINTHTEHTSNSSTVQSRTTLKI